MKEHYDLLLAAHERQFRYQAEAQREYQRRQIRQSQSNDRRSFKQALATRLIQLGNRLNQETEQA